MEEATKLDIVQRLQGRSWSSEELHRFCIWLEQKSTGDSMQLSKSQLNELADQFQSQIGD